MFDTSLSGKSLYGIFRIINGYVPQVIAWGVVEKPSVKQSQTYLNFGDQLKCYGLLPSLGY